MQRSFSTSEPPLTIAPLGIDNVLFDVVDLETSVAFYVRCGLELRWRSNDKGIALFAIGGETPGLLLRAGVAHVGGGRLWIEVRDADSVAHLLEAEGIQTIRIETGTGVTVEARDPSGNTIGFADYRRRPDLRRR